MIYAIAAKSGQKPGWYELEHAIRRNFGGLIERKPVEIFKRHFQASAVSVLGQFSNGNLQLQTVVVKAFSLAFLGRSRS